MYLSLANVTLYPEPSTYRKCKRYKQFLPTGLQLYDASLEGIGVVLHTLDTDSQRSTLVVLSTQLPFDLAHDASFQNTAEFIAIVIGIVMLARRGIVGAPLGIALLGDNTSSLSWAQRERFKEGRSRRAAIIFITLCSVLDIRVEHTEHQAGVKNVICDGLSRGTTPLELGYTKNQILDINSDHVMQELLQLCDPTTDAVSHESIVTLCINVRHLATLLLN